MRLKECVLCGGKLTLIEKDFIHRQQVVKNVEMSHCVDCGENFIEYESLSRIERELELGVVE